MQANNPENAVEFLIIWPHFRFEENIKQIFDKARDLDNYYTRSPVYGRRLNIENKTESKNRNMKKNSILTVAAFAAAVSLTPNLIDSVILPNS